MSIHHPPPRYRDVYHSYDLPHALKMELPQYVSRRDYPPQGPEIYGRGSFENYNGYDEPPHYRSGAGRGAGGPNFGSGSMDAGSFSADYYQPPSFSQSRRQMLDMRDPTLNHSPPRMRTPNHYNVPGEIITGLESLSLHSNINNPNGKKPTAKPVGSLAREFEGVGALGLSPTNKPYHDPRRERKAPEGNEPYRLTWSQTRRIQNLNRPMIPVSIKIPLHDKHLWWESPTVTLNMFAPYSHALVNGEKTIETRNYQLPNKCKGVRIGIVEIMPKNLPSKKPELIGEVVFVDCKEYTSKEEWEKDAPYHKVDPKDERFGWKKNKKKFGWVVHTWQAYDRAIREAASEYCNTRVHYTKNFFVWAYV